MDEFSFSSRDHAANRRIHRRFARFARRRPLWAAASAVTAVTVGVAAVTAVLALVAPADAPDTAGHPPDLLLARRPGGALAVAAPLSRCPWLESAIAHHRSPAALADDVLARMTTGEKVAVVVLHNAGGYENANGGVPRLCIPALVLQDGPVGLAGMTDVTQLPSPLAVAASFDPAQATAYGTLLGSEALAKGVDAVQAPNLNLDRVPANGRAFEGFGEDPSLTSSMGVAEIAGIQGQGVMAEAKHFAAYQQETGRVSLDTRVPDRALHELYLRPFRAAVQSGHVQGIMCAYPELDGTPQCEDRSLTSRLDSWGFTGFTRTDLGAYSNDVAAITSGTDMLKPADPASIEAAVDRGALSVASLNEAVDRVLEVMFANGLVQHPRPYTPDAVATSTSHVSDALAIGERGIVLLRDERRVLPVSGSEPSIALIGSGITQSPDEVGHGSSHVRASSPEPTLADAVAAHVSPTTALETVDAELPTSVPAPAPSDWFAQPGRSAHGLHLTVRSASGAVVYDGAVAAPSVDVCVGIPPAAALAGPVRSSTTTSTTSPAHRRPAPAFTRCVRPRAPLAGPSDFVVLPPASDPATAVLTGTLTVPASGLYEAALEDTGGATLSLDGRAAVANPGTHGDFTWSTGLPLAAGHPYQVEIAWDLFGGGIGEGARLALGLSDQSPTIQAAVQAARASSVAVVVVRDLAAESADRPSLELPGIQDQLVEAVAAANPDTVVVLATEGPVLMPWQSSVAGILETWYQGEVAGPATADALFGTIDPQGHLPVTFPASAADAIAPVPAPPAGSPTGAVSTYGEGLAMGYRADELSGVAPLYPFGFGLSYTTFAFGTPTIRRSGTSVVVDVPVADTGTVSGVAVPQLYIRFPASAGEPPEQLVGFASVPLEPGQVGSVTITVPRAAFEYWTQKGWTTAPGAYALSVGSSVASLGAPVALGAP